MDDVTAASLISYLIRGEAKALTNENKHIRRGYHQGFWQGREHAFSNVRNFVEELLTEEQREKLNSGTVRGTV